MGPQLAFHLLGPPVSPLLPQKRPDFISILPVLSCPEPSLASSIVLCRIASPSSQDRRVQSAALSALASWFHAHPRFIYPGCVFSVGLGGMVPSSFRLSPFLNALDPLTHPLYLSHPSSSIQYDSPFILLSNPTTRKRYSGRRQCFGQYGFRG